MGRYQTIILKGNIKDTGIKTTFLQFTESIKVQTSPQTKKLFVITAGIAFIIYLIAHIFHTLQFTILPIVR